MNLYLATIHYTIKDYGHDHHRSLTATHLVKAKSVTEAMDKAIKHYEDMTSEYAVYYNVSSCKVAETIQ